MTVVLVIFALDYRGKMYYQLNINHRGYDPVTQSLRSEHALINRLRGMVVDYVLWIGPDPSLDTLQTLKCITDPVKGDVMFVKVRR